MGAIRSGQKIVPASMYPKSPLDWMISGKCKGHQEEQPSGALYFTGCPHKAIALVYVGFLDTHNEEDEQVPGRFCVDCLHRQNELHPH